MTNARERAARLACWKGDVAPEPLGGGITNVNFTVDDGAERYVVRIGEDIPVHGVYRVNELAAARAAHAAGISPEIVHTEPGALVMRWVDGRTLDAAEVRDPGPARTHTGHRASVSSRHTGALSRHHAHVLGLSGRARLCAHTAREREPDGGAASMTCSGARPGSNRWSVRWRSSSATTTCWQRTSSTTATGSG